MTTVITNKAQLQNHFAEIERLLQSGKAVNLTYETSHKPKTKAQLGFIFGGLIATLQRHFKEQGNFYTDTFLKETFYEEFGLKKYDFNFLGKMQKSALTLSSMTVDQCSKFINDAIDCVDNNTDCILPPDIRYCWTRHITQEDMLSAKHASMTAWGRLQPEYLSYQRTQACIRCGIMNQTEAHHLRIGNDSGMALKNPDFMTIPLCTGCHKELHNMGERTFYTEVERVINMDIQEFVLVAFQKWYFHKNTY